MKKMSKEPSSKPEIISKDDLKQLQTVMIKEIHQLIAPLQKQVSEIASQIKSGADDKAVRLQNEYLNQSTRYFASRPMQHSKHLARSESSLAVLSKFKDQFTLSPFEGRQKDFRYGTTSNTSLTSTHVPIRAIEKFKSTSAHDINRPPLEQPRRRTLSESRNDDNSFDERKCLASAIQEHIEDLREQVIFKESELPDFLQREMCLTGDECDELRNVKNRKNQVRRLVKLLTGRDITTLRRFVQYLKEEYKDVYEKIDKKFEEFKQSGLTEKCCSLCLLETHFDVQYAADALWSKGFVSENLYYSIVFSDEINLHRPRLWRDLICEINLFKGKKSMESLRILLLSIEKKQTYSHLREQLSRNWRDNFGKLKCSCRPPPEDDWNSQSTSCYPLSTSSPSNDPSIPLGVGKQTIPTSSGSKESRVQEETTIKRSVIAEQTDDTEKPVTHALEENKEYFFNNRPSDNRHSTQNTIIKVDSTSQIEISTANALTQTDQHENKATESLNNGVYSLSKDLQIPRTNTQKLDNMKNTANKQYSVESNGFPKESNEERILESSTPEKNFVRDRIKKFEHLIHTKKS